MGLSDLFLKTAAAAAAENKVDESSKSKLMLKCYIELRGAAETGDNPHSVVTVSSTFLITQCLNHC